MSEDRSIKKWFGDNLAELLSEKINMITKNFDSKNYIDSIRDQCEELGYTKRIELHADMLNRYLPGTYPDKLKILLEILGDENPNETGMFKEYYWIMPVGKFIEKYGLDYFDISVKAIGEVTKRNTGEYAIRPYIRKYPEKSLNVMKEWSMSENFHLRRLSSEGLRPKLPWATKLDTFIEKPEPVFEILDNLMEDNVKFVKKSVANNITDYLKVNREKAVKYIKKHQNSENKNTQWILKYATRKIKV
ncbi:MAG: 3-methyladenine DNA glycosylase [Clostridiales bacterium]|nr:MAG: 3-methyladenine DNA glycosylase [Clostridiales bacterium]